MDIKVMDELMQQISELSLRVKKNMHASMQPSCHGLNVPKLLLLQTIHVKGTCKVSQLGDYMSLTSGAITTAINQLEKENYIERMRDKEDRRVVWVSITEKGEQTIHHIAKQKKELWKSMFTSLDENEVSTLLQILYKMNTKQEGEQ